MCGIAGYSMIEAMTPGADTRSRPARISPQGPSTSDLERALAALAHRGPDGCGIFEDVENGIGLIHTRLSVLDLSAAGHQPMRDAAGRAVLVFNGEIYNFRELRAELEAAGHQFRSHSDTEVLLRLYMAEGEAMLPRLNGIFSFALWDVRRGAMLIARDALGVKPLYYSAIQDRFAFSSEIKALQHLVPATTEVDYAALHRYVSFLWCPGESTPLAAVKKLAPGDALWVRRGRIERRFTWYKLPVFNSKSPRLGKADSLIGIVTHLRQAVHRQMVADVPVGSFLSGGLDSSSVVAFAREINPNIQCFTIETTGGADPGMADDLPYARQVAVHLNVPLEVVRIDSFRMADDLEAMVAQLDEPLADPASLNVLYISRLAREHGIKVLLSGAGGDDLLTGYRRHRALQAERYWTWLPGWITAELALRSARLGQHRPFCRRVRKLFSVADVEGDARLVSYFRWATPTDIWALYSAAFRAGLAEQAAEDPMLTFLAALPTSTTPLERMLALEQRFFLGDHNLTYTDKMSMAVGVEVRVPFLDLDLVTFANQIPVGLKQRGNQGKWVLKRAMEPYLPRNVIYRPKRGFGAPLRRWMRFELRELLGDLLSEETLRRRGLFDPKAVQQLISANDAGKVDASYTLLSLLCIEIWFRKCIDEQYQEGGPKHGPGNEVWLPEPSV